MLLATMGLPSAGFPVVVEVEPVAFAESVGELPIDALLVVSATAVDSFEGVGVLAWLVSVSVFLPQPVAIKRKMTFKAKNTLMVFSPFGRMMWDAMFVAREKRKGY